MGGRRDFNQWFCFIDLQDLQELTNFFERRVSSYQVGVRGEVGLNHTF